MQIHCSGFRAQLTEQLRRIKGLSSSPKVHAIHLKEKVKEWPEGVTEPLNLTHEGLTSPSVGELRAGKTHTHILTFWIANMSDASKKNLVGKSLLTT